MKTNRLFAKHTSHFRSRSPRRSDVDSDSLPNRSRCYSRLPRLALRQESPPVPPSSSLESPSSPLPNWQAYRKEEKPDVPQSLLLDVADLVLHQNMLDHGFHTILLSRCRRKLTFRARNDHIITAFHPNELIKLGRKDRQTCVRVRQFHLVDNTLPTTDYLKHVSAARPDNTSECLPLFGNGIIVQDRRRHSFTIRCFPLLKGHLV